MLPMYVRSKPHMSAKASWEVMPAVFRNSRTRVPRATKISGFRFIS